MKQLILCFALIVAVSVAAPSGTISGSAEIDASGIPQFITFDKGGNVGVNFGGYRASAGLGGLLTGNAADGGLHAEAGTPHGQAAGAGLGGTVDANGRTAGGLYAGATAGGGVSAGAGLAGTTSESGSAGGSYAGATAVAEKETHITKVAAAKPAALTFHKHIEVGAVPVAPAVVVHKEKEIVTEKQAAPQYVEKVIHVPSYVEKTIRVPTYVEKTVKVPVQPAVASVNVDASAGDDVGVYKVVQKVRTHHHRPHFHKFKYFSLGGGFGGGNVGTVSESAAGAGAGAAVGGTGTYTIRKQANPQLFNDIFNIPISTLTAVNKLVSGIAAGTSGSVSVSKSVGVTKI